mmetsp:Transcript_11429/g.17210  ORF Transcript_11429/g.17210 Transcript_11429/m.17210 type:complete len:620 (-) Transcript_11429:74-1933(-)
MPKTGWKFTKQAPSKMSGNMLVKSNASSKYSTKNKKNSNFRSQDTVNRLKMYTTGKAIRNIDGKIVGGQFMMKDRAGDTEITASTGRIAPDRRWFGNTRVVGAKELDQFREEMAEKEADPYSVVLRRKKLPMGLLNDAAEMAKKGSSALKAGLLSNEPFDRTFGGRSTRKRVKLEQMLVARGSAAEKKGAAGGDDDNNNEAQAVASGYEALLKTAQNSSKHYEEINNKEGIVPWGRDSNLVATEGEGVDWRHEKKDDLFLKGQSRRIWAEFYKVVDCSDVILHVIDARNVPGTRCTMIEKHIAKNAPHKHLVFVLNKIDLVPNWVAKRWIGELATDRPTIGFHASLTHAFGKGALINLLRQFGKLLSDKKQISVGVIGYPNVGKSSVINTLISKKSCKVAPVPGETKIWQYITLMKKIYLIDCPGVVVDTCGDTETDSVLKGVVRAERLETPEDYIDAVLGSVKREHIAANYGLPKEGEDSWKDSTELMEKIALKCGRLLKGGEPCLRSAAIMIINDYQRGKLPHYVAPAELKQDDGKTGVAAVASIPGIEPVAQDLSGVGVEYATASGRNDDDDEDDLQVVDEDNESGSEVDEDQSSDDEEDDMPIVVAGGDWDEADA